MYICLPVHWIAHGIRLASWFCCHCRSPNFWTELRLSPNTAHLYSHRGWHWIHGRLATALGPRAQSACQRFQLDAQGNRLRDRFFCCIKFAFAYPSGKQLMSRHTYLSMYMRCISGICGQQRSPFLPRLSQCCMAKSLTKWFSDDLKCLTTIVSLILKAG